MAKLKTWSFYDRQKLEMLLKKGFSIMKILEVMDISRPTIQKELRIGCSADEYKERRYVMYSAARAVLTEAKEKWDAESLQVLREALNAESEEENE